eukprot:TRINITY_DN67549_c13_g7_i1.p1 TRINITY_DN67549_c13_g7~~TRINITY_DN67549_c13_g7_i1.p1  ORF type:complete len:342 (-),score=105.80 TRINITY_DN67549_c13_g7_i1:32-1057(-)
MMKRRYRRTIRRQGRDAKALASWMAVVAVAALAAGVVVSAAELSPEEEACQSAFPGGCHDDTMFVRRCDTTVTGKHTRYECRPIALSTTGLVIVVACGFAAMCCCGCCCYYCKSCPWYYKCHPDRRPRRYESLGDVEMQDRGRQRRDSSESSASSSSYSGSSSSSSSSSYSGSDTDSHSGDDSSGSSSSSDTSSSTSGSSMSSSSSSTTSSYRGSEASSVSARSSSQMSLASGASGALRSDSSSDSLKSGQSPDSLQRRRKLAKRARKAKRKQHKKMIREHNRQMRRHHSGSAAALVTHHEDLSEAEWDYDTNEPAQPEFQTSAAVVDPKTPRVIRRNPYI